MLLDIILFSIIFVASFIGFTRGLLKEIFLFIGFVSSIIFTYVKHDLVVSLFDLEPSLITKIVSTAVVYTFSLVFCIIANTVLMGILRPIRCGVFDRVFGTFIGFLKGVVVAYVLIVVIKLFFYTFFPIKDSKTGEIVFPEWFDNSISYKVSSNVIDKMVKIVAPENFNSSLQSIGKDIVSYLETKGKKKIDTVAEEKVDNNLRSNKINREKYEIKIGRE